MKKDKRLYMLLFAIGAAVALLTWFLIRRKRDPQDTLEAADAPVQPEAPEAASPIPGTYPNPDGANRGLKNNNPGNLRLTTQAWKGKIPNSQNTDKAFEQFTHKRFGIRAMTRVLKNWIEKGKATTVKDIVSKYAPSHENDTAGYINDLAEVLKVSPTSPLKPTKDNLKKLVVSMGTLESGSGAITSDEFEDAWTILS